MSFILLGILNSQVTGAGGGSYELIESNILTTSASSVTFSSIPQDYKHLQIRAVVQNSGTSLNKITFNGDTGTNYDFHSLTGTGSSVTSAASNNVAYLDYRTAFTSDGANLFAPLILDLLDYSSTSKNSTARLFTGYDRVSFAQIMLRSGLWRNTAAVTSITFDANTQQFVSGSRFSLYGVRG